MASPQKQNQISNLPNLNDYALENIFNIYQENGQYFYNILNTINFPPPSELRSDLYTLYTLKAHDIWPLVSYQLYGNIRLWWILCMVNQIQDPLVMPKPGTKIIVLTNNAVNQVLAAMNQ